MRRLLAVAFSLMPALTPAAEISEANLRKHVAALAADIGERNVWHPRALAAAEDYIRRQWVTYGYSVRRQDIHGQGQRVANLEVERLGTARAKQIIVVGAHYDSVRGSPGANDNASGVAALLELARCLAQGHHARTVRFVAFVNEEPPFFATDEMGSAHYARAARARGDDIRAMVALETMGYYSDAAGSQKYPPMLARFYPDRGHFIGFVSDLRSRALLKQAVAAFRAATDFPVEHVATLASLPGIDWSDHRSFWRQGYPALMITDTAPYRYPHYHTAQDTPDKIDYPRLARVTQGLLGMLERLAAAQ